MNCKNKEIMRTVLDFKAKTPKTSKQVYIIKRVKDILNAIEDQEIRGYRDRLHIIFDIPKTSNFYAEITEGYGFDVGFSAGTLMTDEGKSNFTHTIRYFGYSVWVYYNEKDEPVHFDFQGSKTIYPPHTMVVKSDWFNEGKFARYEKVTLI